MCGGAIISNFIPPASLRSQRAAAHNLWPELRKKGKAGRKIRPAESDDDFEADFREFEDEPEEDEVVEEDEVEKVIQVRPRTFRTKPAPFFRGKWDNGQSGISFLFFRLMLFPSRSIFSFFF